MLMIDTCTLVWLTGQHDRLSPAALQALNSPANSLGVSAISALEVGLGYKKQRLALPVEPLIWFEKTVKTLQIAVIPVTWEIAIRSAALPDVHADPFDRLIVATALSLSAAIVTPDSEIKRYPAVSTIW